MFREDQRQEGFTFTFCIIGCWKCETLLLVFYEKSALPWHGMTWVSYTKALNKASAGPRTKDPAYPAHGKVP